MHRVIGGFKCPYTGRIYHVGDEYDGKYLDEMIQKGYIKKTKEASNFITSKAVKPKKSKE